MICSKDKAALWRNVRQSQVRELLLDILHKFLPDTMLQIELLVLVSLLHAGVPANRADIDHAVSEFNECSSLDRNVQVRNVVQDELCQFLVVLLANPFDKAVRGQRHTHAVRRQAILGEAEVEKRRDWDGSRAQLFLLFDKIGTTDEADCYFVSEGGEELEDFGRDGLVRGGISSCVRSERDQTTMSTKEHTRRAGVRVPSTSNKQMVFFTGLWSRPGTTDAAAAAIAADSRLFCVWYSVLNLSPNLSHQTSNGFFLYRSSASAIRVRAGVRVFQAGSRGPTVPRVWMCRSRQAESRCLLLGCPSAVSSSHTSEISVKGAGGQGERSSAGSRGRLSEPRSTPQIWWGTSIIFTCE